MFHRSLSNWDQRYCLNLGSRSLKAIGGTLVLFSWTAELHRVRSPGTEGEGEYIIYLHSFMERSSFVLSSPEGTIKIKWKKVTEKQILIYHLSFPTRIALWSRLLHEVVNSFLIVIIRVCVVKTDVLGSSALRFLILKFARLLSFCYNHEPGSSKAWLQISDLPFDCGIVT